MEKPRFKRKDLTPKEAPRADKRSKAEAREVNGTATKEQQLMLERDRLNDQLMMTEWALTGGKQQVYAWLQDTKGFSLAQAKRIVQRRPIPMWHNILEYVQNHYSNSLVKRHMEQAALLNDQHMMAAKLGMAKAMEFLSKMSIEQKVDKAGRPYFAHFRTADLKNCLDSIQVAQKITRTALGLPTDEGSVHIWQKIQQTINMSPPKLEDLPPEGEDLKVQVLRLQRTYSYDDIKEMITAFRHAGLRSDPNTIEAESETKP